MRTGTRSQAVFLKDQSLGHFCSSYISMIYPTASSHKYFSLRMTQRCFATYKTVMTKKYSRTTSPDNRPGLINGFLSSTLISVNCLRYENGRLVSSILCTQMISNSLSRVQTEKDVGVTFDVDMTFRHDITLRAPKANNIMGIIRRNYTYLDIESFKPLFKSLVRPHLEYGAPV